MSARRNFFPDYDYLHSVFEIKDGRLYNKIQRNSRVKIGQLTGSNSGQYSTCFFEWNSLASPQNIVLYGS